MGVEIASESHRAGPARSLAAAFVFVAMLFAALSLWTAIPLGWIYIGSKVSHTQFPSGGPYFVVAIGIVVSVLVVAWLIGRLNRLYIQVTGTNRLEPMRPAWLKSMRDSSAPRVGSTTVVEAVLMGSVVLAAAALTVWFFFLAGSPIPNQ
jgi:hypothetical protein